MNRILKQLTFREIILELIPSLAISLLIAESFYKLGSFALECTAFLVTWFLIGYAINSIQSMINTTFKNK